MAKTTKLDAVNDMLKAIGTLPVSSLNVASNSDAAIADTTLESVKKEVLGQGWWFNTNYGQLFAPSANQITVPSTVLSLRPARESFSYAAETKNLVERDGKVYDQDSNSFTIAVSVRLDTIVDVEFENLPENMRRYVTVRAARIFQTQVLGDDTLGVYTLQQENEAFSLIEGDQVTKQPASNIYEMRARRRFESLLPNPNQGSQQQPQRGR